jgi:hypothetical protein
MSTNRPLFASVSPQEVMKPESERNRAVAARDIAAEGLENADGRETLLTEQRQWLQSPSAATPCRRGRGGRDAA